MTKALLLAPLFAAAIFLGSPYAHAQSPASAASGNSGIQLQTVTPNPVNGQYNTANAGLPSGINTAELNLYKNGILGVINGIAMPILIALAFLVFLWGVAKAYILKGASESDREKGHEIILWGVIGFVVIFAIWGIVNIALEIFGLTGSVGQSASGSGLLPPQL